MIPAELTKTVKILAQEYHPNIVADAALLAMPEAVRYSVVQSHLKALSKEIFRIVTEDGTAIYDANEAPGTQGWWYIEEDGTRRFLNRTGPVYPVVGPGAGRKNLFFVVVKEDVDKKYPIG